MTINLTEEHARDEETDALSALARGNPYVFVAVDPDANPVKFQIITGGGPQSTEDIELILSTTLDQLRKAREES